METVYQAFMISFASPFGCGVCIERKTESDSIVPAATVKEKISRKARLEEQEKLKENVFQPEYSIELKQFNKTQEKILGSRKKTKDFLLKKLSPMKYTGKCFSSQSFVHVKASCKAQVIDSLLNKILKRIFRSTFQKTFPEKL